MILLNLIFIGLVSSATIPDCITSAEDGTIAVLVQLKAPTAVINEIQRLNLPSDEKALKLVANLKNFSTTSQKDLVEYLDGLKQLGKVEDYRTYFISNTIVVDVAREIVQTIASFKGVREVSCSILKKHREKKSISQIQGSHLSFEYPEYGTNKLIYYDHPSFYGPGIHRMNVPELEDAVFQKASSLVIGIQDTGVDFMHQALYFNYKGKQLGHFNHNYTFFDGTRTLKEIDRSNDANNHGTSVLSIAVGEKPLGVSPQSKWIACKALGREDTTAENFLSCQQFFLAPSDLRGENPNALLRPHVIINSWVCPREYNCLATPFKYTDHAHYAAGIFNVVAAGNNWKETCGTITSPPSENRYSFVVAGLDQNSTKGLAMSSVGPSCYRKNAIDVAASGQKVLTAYPYNGYMYNEGTSYATPLVAGGALLVMAACPHLQRDPEGIARVLRNSATPLYSVLGCGNDDETTIPNNEFGYGLVNIKEAIAQCKITAA